MGIAPFKKTIKLDGGGGRRWQWWLRVYTAWVCMLSAWGGEDTIEMNTFDSYRSNKTVCRCLVVIPRITCRLSNPVVTESPLKNGRDLAPKAQTENVARLTQTTTWIGVLQTVACIYAAKLEPGTVFKIFNKLNCSKLFCLHSVRQILGISLRHIYHGPQGLVLVQRQRQLPLVWGLR